MIRAITDVITVGALLCVAAFWIGLGWFTARAFVEAVTKIWRH